jgi:hypothetical protein
MVDIPGPPPPPSGDGGDATARQEQILLQNKPPVPALDEARHRYALALIEIKRSFLSGVRVVAYILPFLGLVMLGIWLIHIAAPESWRWLTVAEVNHLQGLLFSGAISALATAFATKII